jgi:hypothetical protein
MAAVQGSTLYGGDVSSAIIYQIKNGLGFQWKDYIKTEVRVGGKPRQLTRAIHADDPLKASVKNPRMAVEYATTPTITIDGRNLAVTKLMYNNKMSPEDFMDTFPEYQPTGSAIDLAMAPAIQSAVFDLAMNSIKTQINKLHAIGDVASSPSVLEWYDGFVTLFLADGDATEVGAGAALTSGNILARVKALVNAIPERLAEQGNLVCFCSFAAYKLYQDARAETQTYLPTTDIEARPTLLQAYGSNVRLVPIMNMTADVMFITPASTDDSSNLVQGVWVENDSDALKMYKEVPEADEDWLILMKFYIGIQYKTGKDIYYMKGV